MPLQDGPRYRLGIETSTDTSARSKRLPLHVVIGVTALSLAVALLVAVLVLRAGGDSDAGPVDVQDVLDAEASATTAGDGDLDPGDPAPATAFEYFDGSSGSVTDFQGAPLVVNFFSTSCATCVTEMPGFEAAHEDLAGEVSFLGLNVGDTVEDGLELVEQTGVTFDVARDPDSTLLSEFGGIAMPHTVFIAADGTVAKVNSGLLTEEALREIIDQELR